MANKSLLNENVESLGCHLSWPELRPCVVNKETLRREEDILAKEKWDFNDRPTYYTAVRNLQGFIAFHLNDHQRAQAFFQDVLDKDERNINALGNLAFLHRKLCQMHEYWKYHGRLTEMLSRNCTKAERAMAYADKAHAIRYLEHKRCFRYMRFIERAVTVGRECKGPQKAEWLFDYALALYKRDYQMLYLRELAGQASFVPEHSEWYSDERILRGFKEACRFFLEVARTTTSIDYRALSWVFLGILVNHDPRNRSIAVAFPDQPELQLLTAADCLEKGLEMHPEHAILIRRVGSEYVKVGNYDKARPLLEKSLSKCESQFVYRYLAVMFLGIYERGDKEFRRTEEGRQILQQAAQNFTRAIEMRQYPADYSDLGYVYALLGRHAEAISNFSHAVDSEHDHFFDPVQNHQRWARCLGELDNQEGSRLQVAEAKRVREEILRTPLAEDQDSAYFNDDFDYYSTVEKPNYVRILEDYHFVAPPRPEQNSTLRECTYRYDFFVWHADRDSRWAEVFVQKLETEHRLVGCMQSRDVEGGRYVSEAFVDCLKCSYKFVIILTPHPLDPSPDDTIPKSVGWERFAVEQALFEANNHRGGPREYILPVVLRDCSLPVTLQTVPAIKCKEGQILTEHWEELVRKLTQSARCSDNV
ncbi:uncharacterized protein LOC110982568 [Acanthaster planci]|uniref:Uncharacterized protein LOC110982568 n=1 Tax=Acanthaster planci TaxID=133434 RepID=A0A8B7YTY0_ACAPL|nr:uncharacterized protein LOC110982568 [Acanthaster planci]